MHSCTHYVIILYDLWYSLSFLEFVHYSVSSQHIQYLIQSFSG